ncbi:hypothetical protein KCP70_14945 [Salmonella enterica subsp. enterica]|nr:hypothetical protein KCP70_14945 [Salmonella enterica subsp. enterica]
MWLTGHPSGATEYEYAGNRSVSGFPLFPDTHRVIADRPPDLPVVKTVLLYSATRIPAGR